MAAVRHYGFSKLACCCHVTFVGMLFRFIIRNQDEVGQSTDKLWPNKNDFQPSGHPP